MDARGTRAADQDSFDLPEVANSAPAKPRIHISDTGVRELQRFINFQKLNL